MTGLDFFHLVFPTTETLSIFDVGAHVGESVSSFLSLFPRARIHAFEPAPENFRELQAKFAAETRVHLNPVAIGAADGRTRLHLSNYNAAHSVLPINAPEMSRWSDATDVVETGVLEVAQRSIDSLLAEFEAGQLDVLKLDVQGGELLALQGARAALSAHRIGCIFAEVEFRALYAGQPLAWDIHAYLSGLGYQFINFSGPKLTNTGLLSWADAIYVNPSIWAHLAASHAAGKRVRG